MTPGRTYDDCLFIAMCLKRRNEAFFCITSKVCHWTQLPDEGKTEGCDIGNGAAIGHNTQRAVCMLDVLFIEGLGLFVAELVQNPYYLSLNKSGSIRGFNFNEILVEGGNQGCHIPYKTRNRPGHVPYVGRMIMVDSLGQHHVCKEVAVLCSAHFCLRVY